VAAGWFVLVAFLNAAGQHTEDRIFEGATVVSATVDAGYRPGTGDLTVPVRIGERRVETRSVYDAPLPVPGETVLVEVAAGQPGVVRLTGSSYALPADLARQVGPLLVCGVLAAGRRRFARQAMARAAGEGPTFGLVGTIRPSPISRFRCQLDLYGLDAANGAPPVVSVPLAATAGLPLEVPLAVECKGVPRPYGLLVSRVGDTVLWPSAPATGAGRRPGRAAGQALVPPAALPLATAPPPVAAPRLLTRRGVLVAIAALVALASVAVLGRIGVARDDDRRASWPQAPATVLGSSSDGCSVDVSYRAAGEERRAVVPVGDCSTIAEGPGHLVLVDPEDPDRALLLSALYDPWTPLGWAGFACFVALWWAGDELHRHRRIRAAMAGAWRRVVVAGDGDRTVLRAEGDPPGAARCYSSSAIATWGREPVAVAGDVEPGGTFVSRQPGSARAVEHRGRGRAELDLPFRR